MAERTKRGEQERKREDQVMTTGEPVDEANKGTAAQGGTQASNTTKDKGVEPDDSERGGDKKS